MNLDSKQLLNWGFGILLTILTYNFSEMRGDIKNLNNTMTTIMIQNQDIIRRVSVLEADNTDNKERWKKTDDFTRNFFETYELHKKK